MEKKFPSMTSICLVATSAIALYSACSLKASYRNYSKTIGAINFRELRTEIRHLGDLIQNRTTI